MTTELESYSNMGFPWKSDTSEETHKWMSQDPVERHHEETHSDTASSPQSSSGTIGSDVVSSLSPDSQPTTVSPVQTTVIPAAEFDTSNHPNEAKPHDDIKQEYSELNVDTTDLAEDPKSVEERLANLPDVDPSLPAAIAIGAKFESFAHFESVFEPWKRQYFHPFRVASSETMKHRDGGQDRLFRYRYIVYHCIHYGNPRMRGNGKRPNQSYLPSGCKAMLRLNFSYNDNSLRITTLHTEHRNHEVGPEHFNVKCRKISPLSELNSKKGSPRSTKSSSSSKPSPATTLSSSLSTSPTNMFSLSTTHPMSHATEGKPDLNQSLPTPSLATLLATAYNANNNGFPMFSTPPSIPSHLMSAFPLINNSPLAIMLSQNENFPGPKRSTEVSANRTAVSQQSQFPQSLSVPSTNNIQDLLSRENFLTSFLNQSQPLSADNSNVISQIFEVIQKRNLEQTIQQYREQIIMQEKRQAKLEEYRTLVNTISNGGLPTTDLDTLEHIITILRPVAEYVQAARKAN